MFNALYVNIRFVAVANATAVVLDLVIYVMALAIVNPFICFCASFINLRCNLCYYYVKEQTYLGWADPTRANSVVCAAPSTRAINLPKNGNCSV